MQSTIDNRHTHTTAPPHTEISQHADYCQNALHAIFPTITKEFSPFFRQYPNKYPKEEGKNNERHKRNEVNALATSSLGKETAGCGVYKKGDVLRE